MPTSVRQGLAAVILVVLTAAMLAAQPLAAISAEDSLFLRMLQEKSFRFFWEEANPATGLIKDRSASWSPSSIAAIGFGLTSICIAIDNRWINRAEGRDRVLTTVRTLWYGHQGPERHGTIGYKGFFYHFLDPAKGTRFWDCELSSVDTGLLLLGLLDAKAYFDGDHEREREIRALVDSIYRRVDWEWMSQPDAELKKDGSTIGNGWFPETGFIRWSWQGYNEGLFLYILALGAPVHPLPSSYYDGWLATYRYETWYGMSFFAFPPLFGHHYGHCWIDFRSIADRKNREFGLTYFENSRRATLANRAYCIENPGGFVGYSDSLWGLTACDGPDREPAKGYFARGAPNPELDDGTIAPTAAGGSIPFTPYESLQALKAMYAVLCTGKDTRLWGPYGMRDAFNLTMDWVASDYLGIDQGPIVIMIENFLTQSVWNRFMKIPEIQCGLAAAGFEPVVGR
jgi:hypothetical protein